MALETLKDVKEIGGFPVKTDAEIKEFWRNIQTKDQPADWHKWRSDFPVIVDHEHNTISFKIQDGPIKEVGVNGCQVDTIIEASLMILEGLNAKYPCEQNERAIEALYKAINALAIRRIDREARGVEGTSNA